MAEIDDTTERIADASAMEDAVELSGEGLELLIRIADELQVEQDVEMGGGSPEPTAEPSAEPAMAPSPDEVRREKNRLKVRRHYHRRLRIMNDLRAQVAGLEHQVQQLQASPPTAIDEVAHHHRLRGLEELERVRMALEGENRSLRSRLEMVERGPSAPPLLLIMRQVARREVDMMRPLLLQEVTRTAGPQPSRDFTGLGSVCGWSSRRVIENSMFTFAFKKSVRRPPRQLYLAVWRMLMEPAGVRSIFSPRIKMRCQILQSIDADNVLAVIDYYPLDSRPGEATRRCKTLFLIAKFDGQDGGKSIVIRAVDRYRLLLADAVGTADEWADLFAWFHFAPAGDGKSSNVWFGGGIPTVESTCYIWMLEVLFVVLRLETALATFLSQ